MTTLPRWIWVGTWLLAFIAGMINVVGFLSISQQAVTHLTGTTSLFAIAVIEHDAHQMLLLGAILLAFFFGSLISGLIIQDKVLRLGRRYGAVLILESLILVLATALLQRHHMAGLWLAAAACGLQNGMATTYSKAVIRTTHLSGMFTDLGIFLGQALRGVAVEPRRLMLCLVVISAFFCGGLAGAVSFQEIGYNTLLIPAGLTGLTGVSYMLLRWYALRPNK
ncbi:YoaK family protein [Perlucidibaca aquatica]|uniref:YoaK family protein n=1 Tax=Perlucidibaca aquatica TaxID=1852776 RepID=UPI000839F8E2|nr:YoaK family protein [Perlucidibaca aquatica]